MVSSAVLFAALTPNLFDRMRLHRGLAAVGSLLAVLLLLTPEVAVVVGEVGNEPSADAGAVIRSSVPRNSCVFADPPSLNIAAGRLPPAGTDRPLVDPFGEPLSIALRVSRSYSSQLDADWSTPAQDRVRRALIACSFVAFVGPVEQQSHLSPATRAWFADHFDTLVDPTAKDVGLWRRR